MVQETSPGNPSRRQGVGTDSINEQVLGVLREDCGRFFRFLHQSIPARNGGAFADPIPPELMDRYNLRHTELPTLALPGTLGFMDGFSYVINHWYPLIRFVQRANGADDERVLDEIFSKLFPERGTTPGELRDALREDPTGATWLEGQAQFEFERDALAFIGAQRAIAGIRRLHQELATT